MNNLLTKDAILKIGEVSEIDGLKVFVKVDKNKNSSELFYNGDIITNVSVNSYIEIKKGFLSIIGKIDGEKLEEDIYPTNSEVLTNKNRNKRFLRINLIGYINDNGKFFGGTKELPLIGNEAYIITKEKIKLIHNVVDDSDICITIATTEMDDLDVKFPVDGLFNTHIAIFGNTGSGKSNTLAYLYQELCKVLRERDEQSFEENARFMLFDFNGEFSRPQCITPNKKIYNLSTRNNNGTKIPISQEKFLDIEILSVLADATEKTQKPFLKRAIDFYKVVSTNSEPVSYFRNILRRRVTDILQMSDKVKAFLLLDYLKEILPQQMPNGEDFDPFNDIEWHNTTSQFKLRTQNTYLSSDSTALQNTKVYRHIDNVSLEADLLSGVVKFLYLQLMSDVISNRAQNEHISPVINKLKSKQKDIERVFALNASNNFWEENFAVINLHDVNLEMKKTIPLLLAKKEYAEHKSHGNEKSLTIIIDEAHNILSNISFRESETWKDYRLETFEEIIKEGRKFGVFLTISSQRPNDISQTIISQAHNYFIHRLINQRDLDTIANAISYIDRYTELSIPTLPTGTCIFSGIASQTPLKITVKPLSLETKPKSDTLKFSDTVSSLV